jgi:CheY-like chemotaxis protein
MKKILLVEDHAATIELMEHELQFLGYASIVAKDGREAVELAASQQPDLIIMDISLPKLNGLEATARIRETPGMKSTPILAVTARALPGDQQLCLLAGCDGYIPKPFTHRELRRAIRRLLKD